MSDTPTPPPGEPETMTAESPVDAILDAAAEMTPIYVVADLPDGRLLLSRINEYPDDDGLVWISDANEETAFEFAKIYDDFEPGDVLIYAEPELWEESPVNPNDDESVGSATFDAVQAAASDPVTALRREREQRALRVMTRHVDEQEAVIAAAYVRTAAVADVAMEPSTDPQPSPSEDGKEGDESADPDPAGSSAPDLNDPALAELQGIDADGDGVPDEVDTAEEVAELASEFDAETLEEVDDDQAELLDLIGQNPDVAAFSEKLFGASPDVPEGAESTVVDDAVEEPPSALDIIEDAALGDPAAEQSVMAGFEQAYTPDIAFDDWVAVVFPPRPDEPMAVALAWDTAYESAQMWFPLKRAMGRPDALRQPGDDEDVSLSDYETVDPDDPDLKPALTASLGMEPVTAAPTKAERKAKQEADNARYRSRQRQRGRGDLSHEEWRQRIEAAKASARARRKNKQEAKDAAGDGKGGGGGKGKGKGGGKGKKPTKKQRKNADTAKALLYFKKHGLTEAMINRDEKKRVTGKSIFAQARMFGALREAGWQMTISPDGSGSAVSPEGQKLKFGAPPKMSNNPWDPGGGRWDGDGNYINYDEFAKAVDRATGGTTPGHLSAARRVQEDNRRRRRNRR